MCRASALAEAWPPCWGCIDLSAVFQLAGSSALPGAWCQGGFSPSQTQGYDGGGWLTGENLSAH